MKSSNIGGQAVLEGIMMKHEDEYAVAVRKPDGEIFVKKDEYRGVIGFKPLTRIPFIRGIFNFIDSMVLGIQTLTYSAEFYEEEDDKEKQASENGEADKQTVQSRRAEKLIMAGTVLFSVAAAVGIFMVLPYFLSSFACCLRGCDFDCRCISWLPLTVDNVRASSRQHKRCGTSFLFFVLAIGIILLLLIRVESPVMRVAMRIALLPVIAGISYEVLKLAGRSENPVVNLLSKPGLAVQKLTTKEPDDSMIEVAIQAVEAVFDWRAYESENFGDTGDL